MRFLLCFYFLITLIQSGYTQKKDVDSLIAEIPRYVNQDTLKSKLLLEIARKYYENTDYDKAKDYLNQSYDIAQKLNYTPGMIDYYFVNGRLLKNTGKYHEAKNQYELGLGLCGEINDSNRMASGYNHLGNLFVTMHDNTQAFGYLKKSAQLFEKIHDIKKMAYPLSNIGKIYYDANQFDSAIYFYNRTIGISTKFLDYYELAQSYKRLAQIYNQMEQYPLAFQYCDSSLNISTIHDYRYLIADIYEIQAQIFLKQKEYKESKQKFENCLAIFLQLKVKPSIEHTYKQLSQIDTLEGNYKEAYNHYKLYHKYHDSTVDLENRIKFEKQLVNSKAALNELAATRKRNILYLVIGFLAILSIISILAIRQHNISKQKIAIAQTKNRISQDLHDEIGSALSSISMQTEVLKKRVRNNENIGELVELIKNESRKTMSNMNDLVWSLNTNNDNFPQFINRLRNYCSTSIGTQGLSYEINVEENLIVKNTDLYLFKEVYLIAKEFINNSLKYANCQQIRMDIFKKSDHIYFHIQDDGIGFDLSHIPSSMGGTGLKNMRQRANFIKAQFNFQSKVGVGTYLHLSWNDTKKS
nr:tetratricopeptide repeat protein [Chitinophagaceae bacterium]